VSLGATATGTKRGTRLGSPWADLRWSRFKDREPGEMFGIVSERVCPFLRELGGGDRRSSHHMRDARFTIPPPALLAKVVDMLDGRPWKAATQRATSTSTCSATIASAGQNGQFRTARHIIALMVA
jgi:type I restriction enzyme M protein